MSERNYKTLSLVKCVEDLNKRFNGDGIIYQTRSAPNGEHFLAFCSGGLKKEGEETKTYPNEVAALFHYSYNLKKYIEAQATVGSQIYWRVHPIMRHSTRGMYYDHEMFYSLKEQYFGRGFTEEEIKKRCYMRKDDEYYVYSRLLLSAVGHRFLAYFYAFLQFMKVL